MELVVKSRSTGRTIEMIQRCLQLEAYLVVDSKKLELFITDFCHQQNIPVPKMITLTEIQNKQYYGLGVKQIVYEDIKSIIEKLTPDLHVAAGAIDLQ